MSIQIRVRDVTRNEVYELPPEEPILRGPYELFKPEGAVRRQGALVDWSQSGTVRSARVVSNTLGSAQAGERVLLRLPPQLPEDEWWLCEVEATDGVEDSEA